MDRCTTQLRLGVGNVLADDGAGEVGRIPLFQALEDNLADADPWLVLGRDDAGYGQRRIEGLLDGLHDRHQGMHAFEGKVLGLYGHKQAVGRNHRVDCEDTDGWAAVEQDVVVPFRDRQGRQLAAQDMLAGQDGDELDLGSFQRRVGRHDVKPVVSGRLDRLEDVVRGVTEDTVHGAGRPGNTESPRKVALGVEVYKEDPVAQVCEPGAEVDRGGGLADTTLFLHDAKDHACPHGGSVGPGLARGSPHRTDRLQPACK